MNQQDYKLMLKWSYFKYFLYETLALLGIGITLAGLALNLFVLLLAGLFLSITSFPLTVYYHEDSVNAFNELNKEMSHHAEV